MEYPAVSPRLAGFGFPLKDYAAKPAKTWLPHCGSLDEFLNPPLHSAFCSVRSATHFPHAGGQPKRFRYAHGFGNSQASRNPGNTRLSRFMPSRQPGMKPASRAALR